MIASINNSQPTFGKFSIVKIKKDALPTRESLIAVEDIFEREFNKAITKKGVFSNAIKKMFAIKSKDYVYFLEQPNYAALMDKLKDFGGYSLEWLHMHTGVPIVKPMEEDYHSFVVLTEDELDIGRIMNENVDNFVQETVSYRNFRKSRGEICDELTQEACINHCMTSLFFNLIKDDVPEIYKIDDFSCLKNVVKLIMG